MITVISDNLKEASLLCDMLYYMGFLTKYAKIGENIEIPDFCKAIILSNAENLTDKYDYVLNLRKISNAPIFAFSKKADEEDKILFDKILNPDAYASEILEVITNYISYFAKKIPGDYLLYKINASASLKNAIYEKTPLPFTKCELMILRAIICVYPKALNADEILEYSFKKLRVPSRSSIRTHISVMNKKFRENYQKNLIVATDGGYTINLS